MGTWNGRNDRADFQSFGNIAWVIDFRDLAGGEADLVPVRGVAASGNLTDFLLRQFSGKRLGKGGAWITCAGDSHRLIDVGSP